MFQLTCEFTTQRKGWEEIHVYKETAEQAVVKCLQEPLNMKDEDMVKTKRNYENMLFCCGCFCCLLSKSEDIHAVITLQLLDQVCASTGSTDYIGNYTVTSFKYW